MHRKDLIAGKYYKYEDAGKEIIFKLKTISYNFLILDREWYIYNKEFRCRASIFIDVVYDYKEVEICDFVDYLPHNHPERINYRNQRIKKLLSNEI